MDFDFLKHWLYHVSTLFCGLLHMVITVFLFALSFHSDHTTNMRLNNLCWILDGSFNEESLSWLAEISLVVL
jgi:hypothetical protein